jgi:hypothetical protein
VVVIRAVWDSSSNTDSSCSNGECGSSSSSSCSTCYCCCCYSRVIWSVVFRDHRLTIACAWHCLVLVHYVSTCCNSSCAPGALVVAITLYHNPGSFFSPNTYSTTTQSPLNRFIFSKGSCKLGCNIERIKSTYIPMHTAVVYVMVLLFALRLYML